MESRKSNFDKLPEKEKVSRLITENQRLRKEIRFFQAKLKEANRKIQILHTEESVVF